MGIMQTHTLKRLLMGIGSVCVCLFLGRLPAQQFIQVFGDEFNGTSVDFIKWQDNKGNGFRASSEYTDLWYSKNGDNYISTGTSLKLFMQKETPALYEKEIDWLADTDLIDEGEPEERINKRYFDYSTGAIASYQQFKHGFYEIRFKLSHHEDYLWPAFWTMGEGINEVDIFEIYTENPKETKSNFHCKDNNNNPCNDAKTHCADGYNPQPWPVLCSSADKWSDQFHTIGAYVDDDEIAIFVQGRVVHRIVRPTGSSTDDLLKQQLFDYRSRIIANLGGKTDKSSFDDNFTDPNDLPEFEIDHIRFWKVQDCNSHVLLCNYNSVWGGPNTHSPSVYTGELIIAGGDPVYNCEVLVKPNTGLTLLATDEVTLLPGFHAEPNSIFSAKIVPCSADPVQPYVREGHVIDYHKTEEPSVFAQMRQQIDEFAEAQENPVVEQIPLSVIAFPNPTDGAISVEVTLPKNQTYTLQVTDLMGRVLMEKKEQTFFRQTLDLNGNPAGVYLIKVSAGAEQSLVRIALD